MGTIVNPNVTNTSSVTTINNFEDRGISSSKTGRISRGHESGVHTNKSGLGTVNTIGTSNARNDYHDNLNNGNGSGADNSTMHYTVEIKEKLEKTFLQTAKSEVVDISGWNGFSIKINGFI